jgi:hypothetical protein
LVRFREYDLRGICMRLRSWKMIQKDLVGSVSGSRKYDDGTFIHTSPVISMAYDDGLFMMRTENSIYECDVQDFIGTEVELNLLIENAEHHDRQTTTTLDGYHY